MYTLSILPGGANGGEVAVYDCRLVSNVKTAEIKISLLNSTDVQTGYFPSRSPVIHRTDEAMTRKNMH